MTKNEYRVYLASPHWAELRARYRRSGRPQVCVVCGCPWVQLHHGSYARVGRERLRDLVPLCDEHHEEAHRIRAARRKPKATASAKQLDYIRRLGGRPAAEMTAKGARRLIGRLQKQRARELP